VQGVQLLENLNTRKSQHINTRKSQAKPYAKVTGNFAFIRESHRQNHTPKSQAILLLYAKVTGKTIRQSHR